MELQKKKKSKWLWDPSKRNGDNLQNLRCEAIRHFRNEKREYLKDKINGLAINVRTKTYKTCREQ
jgi:hypothetical protein